MAYFPNQQAERARLRPEMDVRGHRVACSDFSKVANLGREELERPGRALVPPGITWVQGMFAARGYGGSNDPKIKDGAWLLFGPYHGGSRVGRLVLVKDMSQIGGDLYVLKKYTRRRSTDPTELGATRISAYIL
jgi:hypothetical protein